ncbi:FAD-dependent oxidoreductase [Prochlorothrix hollandica]|uniref:FAD-dependent oxidoreductase n=1 Tax=Prochlorothrix hollandica TaxID=1223 RepID=UPI003341326F
MELETIAPEVLVVGGGTGATAAALQSARRGAKTLLVSEGPWLGGMLTSAGVTAPDGNELLSLQTGIWGAFVQALAQQQPGGLDQGWVSFFAYEPALGAAIFAQWVRQLPNLQWRIGGEPLAVARSGNRITGVRFARFQVQAQITIDGTELGDLLALGEVPHRWGWEPQEQWQEPSAPPAAALATDPFYRRYPVQSPTWVVVLRDYGAGATAPPIAAPPGWIGGDLCQAAWERHGSEAFLNYGRFGGDRFMINWPLHGNDYGEGVDRLRGSPCDRQAFLQEARWHSQGFAHGIQTHLGSRYGLDPTCFPLLPHSLGGGAYGLQPYYRESRRLQGLVTVREQDILPLEGGSVAALPLDDRGQITAIAVGNYPNDHHYPGGDIPLQPKSCRWGGRWTGTPFALPYGCLVPATVEGLLVCDKAISVSHMANGATRLQPVVLALGQAAGMAAALCVEQGCQPQDLAVAQLQQALLTDPTAPAAVIPSYDLLPQGPHWLSQQQAILRHPDAYPPTGILMQSPGYGESQGYGEGLSETCDRPPTPIQPSQPPLRLQGQFHRDGPQDYRFCPDPSPHCGSDALSLVTLCPWVNQQLQDCLPQQRIEVEGYWNRSGAWFRVDRLLSLPA